MPDETADRPNWTALSESCYSAKMPPKNRHDDSHHNALDNIEASLTNGLKELTAQWQSASRQQRDDFRELADAIGTLSEQIEVLRNAVDDLREQIQWGQQNGRIQQNGESFEDVTGHQPGSSPAKQRRESLTPTPLPGGRLF